MNLSNRVLVAIDFSPCSAAAFRRAKRIAAWLNAPLTVLHAVGPAPRPARGPFGLKGAVIALPTDQELVSSARKKWDDFARQCGGAGDASLVIEVGNPRDRILEAVRRDKPCMLVIGAHSAAHAQRGIGTTAAACAQWAPTQVLVVREGQDGPFRSVVACVDYSDASRLALEHAISLAAEAGAALNILNTYENPWHGVTPPDDIKRNMPDFAARYREAMETRLKMFCEPLTHELNTLKPVFNAIEAPSHAEGIMAFATRHACDLVVLGTRGKFTMRDYFWGSTAERIVREAPCSVLAIKPPTFVEAEPYQPLADAAAVLQPSP